MRLGVCTSLANAAIAQAAGFDFIEVSTWELQPNTDDAAFAGVIARAQVSPIPVEACNCFIPAKFRLTGPDADLAAVMPYMETVLRRTRELGGSIMVFGSGGARRAPDGFPLHQARVQFLDAIKLAGDIAAKYDVTIVLEPLEPKECNLLTLVTEGVSIVETLAHPNVKVLADLYHMRQSNEPFDVVRTAGSHLAHVHIDVPAVAAGAESYYPTFLSTLVAAGYAGRVSVENHSFTPAEGKELTDYYAAIHAYFSELLAVTT